MSKGNAIAADKLRRAICFVVVYNTVFLAWLILKPGSPQLVVTVDDIAQPLGPLLLLPLCFAGMSRPWRRWPSYVSAAHRWAPVVLGAGVLTDTLGAGIWSFYEQVLHRQTPFPSLDDAAYLCTYPLLLCGILLLPRAPLRPETRSRIVVDGLMALTATVTFSWYFILGPTLLQGGESLLAKLVGTAYPLGDLLLIVCLLVLASSSRDASLRLTVILLALGLVSIVVADCVFDYRTLQGTYATGEIIDVGWPLGDMLICLAAIGLQRSWTRQTVDATAGEEAALSRQGTASLRAVWKSFFPYALLPLVGALSLYTAKKSGDGLLEPGVYVGGTVLIGLVVLRQILAILENRRLYNRLQRAHVEVVAHAEGERRLNQELRAAHEELRENNRALAGANARLEALATTDVLTNLPNHRALVSTLDRELERARRYARPLALLFLDLDHFKALNDSWGHSAGDAALCEFAQKVSQMLRGVDILGRWGGEEFLAILPETDAEGATQVAQRVREEVATTAFRVAGGVHLTCSIGLAVYPEDGESRDMLVDSADHAMYAAKALGRNQVRAAGETAVEALLGERNGGSRDELALTGAIEALAAVVEVRDRYTGRHTQDVERLAVRLALALGLGPAEARAIGWAGRLHDVGKIVVPDAILHKPARLAPDEWAVIHKHPVVGADIVSRVPALRAIAPIIRAHHERWDGGGYPDGLESDAIPLGARILAVADAYGAMTSRRPYQEARDTAWARSELVRCAETQFDPTVVRALERVVGCEPAADLHPRSA